VRCDAKLLLCFARTPKRNNYEACSTSLFVVRQIKPTHAGFPFVRTVLPCKKKPDKFVMGEGVKGRSEPWMMRQVLEVVAGVKGVAEDDVSRHAHFNARRIFGIS